MPARSTLFFFSYNFTKQVKELLFKGTISFKIGFHMVHELQVRIPIGLFHFGLIHIIYHDFQLVFMNLYFFK